MAKEMMKGSCKKGAPSPCAACKLLRRRCTQDCVFAPYFPADQPHKFSSVHKVFGASNVTKLLQELPEQHRSDAVSSLVYEANARIRDPIYGCVGTISCLQRQVDALQQQLAMTQAQLLHFKMAQFSLASQPSSTDDVLPSPPNTNVPSFTSL
ncbi:LOB domain-containing protein 4-like [Cucurbita pepo subsp. pepo]|uniref:LOB domain-containing protein 4-like n=1 Tax=Cucurbita pepo subsp. pepo TaxID=3664 RepID=UPI000C9D7D50|nr:LOB domain-containing protein 4-like [Cucurbita pepo subsp. pepo]